MSLRQTINHNIAAEQRAISDYRQAINVANTVHDTAAARKFAEIMGQEQHHLDELKQLLRTR